MVSCPKCGAKVPDDARFCSSCAAPLMNAGTQMQSGPAYNIGSQSMLWYQSFYRIRKKIVAIANQYWIEDREGHSLGYTKQKLIRLKDDIRIYSDESMSSELFKIKQEQVVDAWGTFAVIDSATEACVGKLKRKGMSQISKDEYLLLDPYGQQIGRVAESSGRGLARKWIPGAAIVPEHVGVEFNGREVAQIRQQFKVIGNVWEVDCSGLPPQFDRRTLLATMLIMGMMSEERR